LRRCRLAWAFYADPWTHCGFVVNSLCGALGKIKYRQGTVRGAVAFGWAVVPVVCLGPVGNVQAKPALARKRSESVA